MEPGKMSGVQVYGLYADSDSKRRPRRARLRIAVWGLVLLFPATGLWAQKSVPHPDLVIAQPVVNMLSQAAAGSDVVSQAIFGTGVQLLEKRGDWYEVRTADEYTGWVAASDVREEGSQPYAPDGHAVQVSSLSANLYREPDVTKHPPVLRVPWESYLETVSGLGDGASRWLQVRLVDGDLAWVQRGDVRAEWEPLSIDEMLRLAQRFQGITYTWGGVSSFGFDCSGFTQMLERQRGIEMPRDAKVQAVWSGVTAVARKDLQPGDLLFFGSSAARITHTGMYLGNGEFIHDTTNGHPGVQISRLNDEPWTTLLVAARRVK